MADLLPSLSSDEEDDTNSSTKRSKRPIGADGDDGSDDDGSDGIMDDFDFGGILGEDGGVGVGLASHTPTAAIEGWSYQTALDQLHQHQKNGNGGGQTTSLPRMDVASIIAAKRKNIIVSNNEGHDDDDYEEQDEQDDDDDDSGSDEENHGSDDDKIDHDDENDSDSNDDSDSDDEVDDADLQMEDDVLKTRIGGENDGDEDGDDNNDQNLKANEGSKRSDDESSENDDNDDEDNDDDDRDSDDQDEEDEEALEEQRKASQFFDTTHEQQPHEDEIEVFTQLTLSRPLLRGVAAMGYVKPTKIQSSVIPMALAGRDICASAVTGSGKTASFLLPILERLLHRSPGRIKALILTPTRELAAQCLGMMSTLAQFTKLTSTLIVGGSKNIQAQTAELRARPQVVVATPGRLLDHITNSAGITLDDVEFLVLDEADRLLDLGFQDEVNEIIKACPVNRQTLLFSATMNTKVDDLIKLSLKRPVRIRISDKDSKSAMDLEVAPRLEQEFVRVRSGNEGLNREAMLLALLTRTFTSQTIVFFDTKAKAHRMMILCGLCGIKCAELHGNLTQAQRLEALEKFRLGDVDILLATDLAARGLDINRVEAVVNYEMPTNVETYIHRIGRTARAGRGGKSCTLIGEGRRHLMKEIMKDATARKQKSESEMSKDSKSAVIRSRSIPAVVVAHFVRKIESLEEHVEDVLQAEAVARMDRVAEMEALRAQNIIEHSDEIRSRPQRQWFASEKEKKMTKEATAEKARLIKEMAGTGTHRMTRKKRRAREAKEMLEAGDDDNDEGDTNHKPKLTSVKKAARDQKREAAEREQSKFTKSIHDDDMERAARRKKARTGAKALGDDTLFGEEMVAFEPKKKKTETDDRKEKSAYNFRGFDPLKKKGKKKSHHKFKSKSKHKRR